MGISKPNPQLDFSGIQTYSAAGRTNLVRIDTLKIPGVTPYKDYPAPELDELAGPHCPGPAKRPPGYFCPWHPCHQVRPVQIPDSDDPARVITPSVRQRRVQHSRL